MAEVCASERNVPTCVELSRLCRVAVFGITKVEDKGTTDPLPTLFLRWQVKVNRSLVNMVSIEQYVHRTKCQLNKCAYTISQLNNVSIEHNLPLFVNMGPNEFTPHDEQCNVEFRIMIQTTIDSNHNESKPWG